MDRRMDITSIIKAVLTPGEERPGFEISDLQPGARLTGRVLRLESDGKVLMDLGGRRALAQVGFAVRAGQTLPLQVVENGPLLHLQVEPPTTGGKTAIPLPKADFSQVLQPREQDRVVALVRQLIDPSSPATPSRNELPESVKSALIRMVSLFEPLPMAADPQQISRWVQHAVEDSGLLFEKKMGDAAEAGVPSPLPGDEKEPPSAPVRILITRDAKSQLLVLRQMLPTTDEQTELTEKLNAKSAGFLRQIVDRLLTHIESRQEQAVSRWADGGNQQIFVHTLQLPDQRNPVQLKIYYPRKEERPGDDRQHRVALLLDMDRLGPVRIDLAMLGRMLQITFYVAHQKAMERMQPEVASVSRALDGLFDHVAVDLFVSRQKIRQFEKEDVQGPEGGGVDLNI
jgi:hypothetical protein